MLSVSRPVDRTPLPPGYRHGFSTPVTNGLRLFCDSSQLDSQTPTRVEAYPSPPMSGSPPLPSTAAHEGHLSGSAANFSARFEGSQGRWPTDPLHNDQGTARDRSHGLLPLSRSYPQETPSRSSHIRRLSENILPSVSRYGTQDPRGIFPIPPRHSPGGSAIYGTPNTGHGPLQDPNSSLPRVTSPKSQRKAKGHVASACLPCKRAHLRCDAQRPCSRCVSNGKEASCKDIQHKKRGRPRLRDERESRHDPARYSLPHELGSRRPPSIHPSAGVQHFGEDSTQQKPLHALDYTKNDPISGTRFLQRVLSAEQSPRLHGQPQATAVEEPVAYLSLGMEFMKASPAFLKAVGSIPGLVGRKLVDVTPPKERTRALTLGDAMIAEQKRLEPNYLPPIFDRGNQVVGRLGLTAKDIADRQLDCRDYLTFIAADGQLRPHAVRLGVFKEAAFYFVMLFLELPAHGPYHSPGARMSNTALHTPQRQISQPNILAQPPPLPPPAAVPASFDGDRRRFSDGPALPQQSLPSPAQHLTPSSPHSSSYQPMYSPSSHGGDYTRPPALQVPRSELGAAPRPNKPEPVYTLPPIRPLPEQGTGAENGNMWQREDRQRRVTIGGLIDKPEISQPKLL